jgi:hypothetical protein
LALADELNVEQQSNEITRVLYDRMVALGWPEDDVQTNANILFEFAKIAGNLMLSEPGIQIPGSDTVIPYDLPMAHQAMELFAEGIYQAVVKSREYGIDSDTRTQMLQSLALDVFGQAKQIVASTMGQDMVTNPALQIPKAQQIEWVQKTAESALSYYAGQMAQDDPPMQDAGLPTTPSQPQMPQAALPAADLNSPESLIPQPPSPSPTAAGPVPPMPPSPPAGSSSPIPALPPLPPGATREKFAATALFLTLLSREQQGLILQQLTPDEHQWAAYFSDWRHLQAAGPDRLDMALIKQHLHSLTQLFLTANHQGSHHLRRRFESLLGKYPREVVSNWMMPERPAVRQWVQQFLPTGTLPPMVQSVPTVSLSPVMAQHLFQYLEQQFG